MTNVTTIRIPASKRSILERAARDRGISLSKFVVQTAVKEAEARIRPSIFDYKGKVEVPVEAQTDLKAYLKKKTRERNAGSR